MEVIHRSNHMRRTGHLCVKNGDDRMSAALPRTGGNENTGLIKLAAIACMIVDHVGVVFFPKVYEFRLIGRIAFPLFAWCLCVGAEYTRNIWKYALRLLIVGAAAQPVYFWAMNHDWKDLNIFFELFIGLLAIAAIQKNWKGSRIWGPLLALLASLALPLTSSYGWQGITFILLLYACRRNGAAIAAFMTAFCLYWSGNRQTDPAVRPDAAQRGSFPSACRKPDQRSHPHSVLGHPGAAADRDPHEETPAAAQMDPLRGLSRPSSGDRNDPPLGRDPEYDQSMDVVWNAPAWRRAWRWREMTSSNSL